MSTETNKAAVLRQVEALSTRDLGMLDKRADELYTADYIVQDPRFPEPGRGPASVKQFVRGILTDMPDLQMTVEDLFAEGDKVASRFTVRGTNAPTGKPATLTAIVISRFTAGKIAEEWELVGPVA